MNFVTSLNLIIGMFLLSAFVAWILGVVKADRWGNVTITLFGKTVRITNAFVPTEGYITKSGKHIYRNGKWEAYVAPATMSAESTSNTNSENNGKSETTTQ